MRATDEVRPDWPQSSVSSSTDRNASWEISTFPTCFIRFLPSFCFSRSLLFLRDVAAVALGGDVLAKGRDRFAGDDPAADGRLDGHLELVAVDLAFELSHQLSAPPVGVGTMDDHGEGIDPLAGHQDVQPAKVAGAVADQVVIHRAVAARGALELVVEVVNHLRQRQFVGQDGPRGREILGLDVNPAPVLAKLHDRADAIPPG